MAAFMSRQNLDCTFIGSSFFFFFFVFFFFFFVFFPWLHSPA
jgi:hypothetical protein